MQGKYIGKIGTIEEELVCRIYTPAKQQPHNRKLEIRCLSIIKMLKLCIKSNDYHISVVGKLHKTLKETLPEEFP